MLQRLFRPKPAREMGKALYAAAVEQARRPALYERLAAPDTVEGRFELYSLHVMLLLDRLKGEGAAAAETTQALFDAYVKSLDDSLREMGVGDLSVGKKMRKLGEAFFGRVKNYQLAFDKLPETGDLEALIARTVYAEGDAAHAPGMAAYVVAQREALAEQSARDLLSAKVSWRAV
jgi:cytochrome b pre-mRNA-processing protein 3